MAIIFAPYNYSKGFGRVGDYLILVRKIGCKLLNCKGAFQGVFLMTASHALSQLSYGPLRSELFCQ